MQANIHLCKRFFLDKKIKKPKPNNNLHRKRKCLNILLYKGFF